MPREPFMRFTVSACGGIFVVAAIAWLLTLVNADRGFSTTTAAMAFGWMLPLGAGGLSATVAWAMLSDEDDTGPAPRELSSNCESCGRDVASSWRLCPDCGELLGDSKS